MISRGIVCYRFNKAHKILKEIKMMIIAQRNANFCCYTFADDTNLLYAENDLNKLELLSMKNY